MQRLDYWQFPGFENIYLEDSYLLDARTNSEIEARVEAVLRETHPFYTPPKPGEQYCYKNVRILFPDVREYRWLERKMTPIHDSDGQVDYGNIDELYLLGGKYYMSGEWGRLEIDSGPPVVVYPP